MGCINEQSKLLELPKPIYQSKKPKYLLNWYETKPTLKRFIYIHLIRVIEEYKNSKLKLTLSNLIQSLARNMGNVVKRQVEIYIENLLFYGLLSIHHETHTIKLTNKFYQDLKETEKGINTKRYDEVEK